MCLRAANETGVSFEQAQQLTESGYFPLPWQWKFHAIARLADKIDGPVDIGLGGARGPGKSHCVLSQVALDDCQRIPGLKCLFLRQTGMAAKESFDDLVDKVILGHIPFKRTGFVLTFENKSRILLGGFRDVNDIDKYIGIEYDLMIVEELDQLTEEKYTKLRGSLRTSKSNWRPRIYTSFNPGGIGHAFVKKRYILPFRERRQKETRFIGSTYKSNPYLNQEYVEYLEGLEGDLGKAWREGDWDLFKGQVFSEWRNLKHVIEEPDYPLELCYKVVGFDWGYNNPGCAFWIAFTPDVRAYGYRELYQSGKNPQEWANQMKIFLQVEKVNEVVLPHDCFSHLGGNETIATIFEETWKDLGENRPFVVRGNTMGTVAVKNRITIFHQYLRDAPDGKPYFQVLSRCTNLIRTLPELIYSKINVEMIDKSGEDHSFDSASIALMRHVEMAMQSGAVKDSGPARVITPNFVSDEEGRIQGPDFWKAMREQTTKIKRTWEQK